MGAANDAEDRSSSETAPASSSDGRQATRPSPPATDEEREERVRAGQVQNRDGSWTQTREEP